MIVLNLQCTDAHPFEGWFNSIDDFERQIQSAALACPMCGDRHVSRLPSGPRVVRKTDAMVSRDDVATDVSEGMAQMMRAMTEMAKSSEDVAEQFPEEVRRMHYGETASRNIRGQATLAETRELLEEGISVMPLPFPVKEDIH